MKNWSDKKLNFMHKFFLRTPQSFTYLLIYLLKLPYVKFKKHIKKWVEYFDVNKEFKKLTKTKDFISKLDDDVEEQI